MANRTLAIEIPSEMYDEFQSPASLLKTMLTLLYAPLSMDIPTLYDALESLPDEYVWMIVYRRLTRAQENRLNELRQKLEQTGLSSEESQERERLLRLIDRHALMRSKALALLKQRGHDIDVYIKQWM